MNTTDVDKIEVALLYEGYMLYPYRRSVKNRKRWTFGCIHPSSPPMQTECLLDADERGRVSVEIRFLQLVDREVARLRSWAAGDRAGRHDDPANWESVEKLECDGMIHQPWQEAVERRVRLSPAPPAELAGRQAERETFAFPEAVQIEPVGSPPVGAIIRRSGGFSGTVAVAARRLEDRLFQWTVQVANTAAVDGDATTRSEPGLESLVSTHIILESKRANSSRRWIRRRGGKPPAMACGSKGPFRSWSAKSPIAA